MSKYNFTKGHKCTQIDMIIDRFYGMTGLLKLVTSMMDILNKWKTFQYRESCSFSQRQSFSINNKPQIFNLIFFFEIRFQKFHSLKCKYLALFVVLN